MAELTFVGEGGVSWLTTFRQLNKSPLFDGGLTQRLFQDHLNALISHRKTQGSPPPSETSFLNFSAEQLHSAFQDLYKQYQADPSRVSLFFQKHMQDLSNPSHSPLNPVDQSFARQSLLPTILKWHNCDRFLDCPTRKEWLENYFVASSSKETISLLRTLFEGLTQTDIHRMLQELLAHDRDFFKECLSPLPEISIEDLEKFQSTIFPALKNKDPLTPFFGLETRGPRPSMVIRYYIGLAETFFKDRQDLFWQSRINLMTLFIKQLKGD